MYIKHETYVDLKTAKLLKQVGFDWACDLYFSELVDSPAEAGIVDEDTNKVYGVFDNPTEDDILRPTIDVAQRWLREVKNYYISIDVDCDSIEVFYTVRYIFHDGNKYNASHIWEKNKYGEDNHQRLKMFNTYEGAQEAGIKMVLELILEKGE